MRVIQARCYKLCQNVRKSSFQLQLHRMYPHSRHVQRIIIKTKIQPWKQTYLIWHFRNISKQRCGLFYSCNIVQEMKPCPAAGGGERKTLPSAWFKKLCRSTGGALSGVLFTHHKPVYYIDIQTTQSTTVLSSRRPRSLFALHTGMLMEWFSDMAFQYCRRRARSFRVKWSESIHYPPRNETKGQERGGATWSGGGVYNPIGD